MKLHVNLFKESGKWAYGSIVEVSGKHNYWDDAFKQELVDNQNFVVDGAFNHYYVVITHDEAWANDPNQTKFYQMMLKPGSFDGFAKQASAITIRQFYLNTVSVATCLEAMSWHDLVYQANGYLPKPLSTVTWETRDGRHGVLDVGASLTIEPGMSIDVAICGAA